MARTNAVAMLSAATVTGASPSHVPIFPYRAFQAVGRTTAGAGAASIDIEGSLDGVNFIQIGNIALTLSTSEVSDGFASDAAWKYIRANVQSISGTGANVDVYLGA